MKTNELTTSAITNINAGQSFQNSLIKLKTLIGTEILMQALGTIAIGVFPLIIGIDSRLYMHYYAIYIPFLIICVFFIASINSFLKNVPQLMQENGQNINEVVKRYTRLCANFSNFIIPFLAIAVFFIRVNAIYNGNLADSFASLSREQWVLWGGLMVFICGVMAVGTYCWLQKTYNKIMSWDW